MDRLLGTARSLAAIASTLLVLLTVGCATSPKPERGLTPDQTQDLFVSANTIPEGGIKRTVVSSWNPDTDFEVTILPPGSKARDKYDVVLPEPSTSAPSAYDTTVPCKICGSPVKIRIRRPQPRTPGDGLPEYH